MTVELFPITEENRAVANELLTQHWGTTLVVSRGVTHDLAGYPGFMARIEPECVGIITYHIADTDCEITSLDSFCENIGVGSALIDAVKQVARAAHCTRLWLITTNDNLRAIGFYQKRGFELVAVHRHALDKTREIKPQVPLIGMNGIPLRDEIEFEMRLDSAQPG